MRLSENFRLREFAVSASFPHLAAPVPAHLIPVVSQLVTTVLQPIRTLWHPMTVLSGYRSRQLNEAVGGSPTSQHRRGEAADITTTNVRGLFMAMLMRPNPFHAGQVIAYPRQNFIHFALPSTRYPSPAFFISRRSKDYTPVATAEFAASLWPLRR